MQKANNKLTLATNFFESDIKSDVDKLSAADKDIANLVRCRTEQRDLIKRQYAQAILTTEQAQQEWKKWGDLIRRDREEMKYLGDALVNITKIEQSYTYAATAIEDPSYVTEEMQKKWQQELQLDHDKALVDAEQSYKGQIAKRGLTNKEKKTLKTEHEHKVSDLKNQFTTKQAAIKNKINPKDNPLKLLVASVHEKHESVQKNKENFDNLAIEAANNKGFEQINSGLSIQQQYAELNLPAWKFAFSGNR